MAKLTGKNLNHLNPKAFYYDRIYVQKIKTSTREQLFVEVNQKDLNDYIFKPLKDLKKFRTHFFSKRLAILGDYRTGKTELSKYIVSKIEKEYQNCISITINSQLIRYKNIDEINDWIFDQWYSTLEQYDNELDFTEKFHARLKKYKDLHGHEPEKYINKISFICKAYSDYLEEYPNSKFIIVFDQANLIEKEEDFIPFFKFWRNFQGYWEMDQYFSELPILIIINGHKNWIDFENLKDSVGRGVFDKILLYNYWNNIDIEGLFQKRLFYATNPKYHVQISKYFLCNGIVEFFGRKLNVSNTQYYLDEYFGKYLSEFVKDLNKNLKSYDNFLDYCKKITKQTKSDKTYFFELEKVFVGSPALDYMPVFQFLSNNQESKWFNDFFNLIRLLYDKQLIKYGSKDFRHFTHLSHEFIDVNFTNSPFDSGFKPEYTPALFTNHKQELILNETFRTCLESINDLDQRGPVYILKRFVKSKRIKRNFFNENKHGSEITRMLENIRSYGSQLLEIVDQWIVEKKRGIIQENVEIPEEYLNKFYNLKSFIIDLTQLYKGKTTDWPTFDKKARDLCNFLISGIFPREVRISNHIDYVELEQMSLNLLSPSVSNISLITLLLEMIDLFYQNIKQFDEILEQPTKPPKPTKSIKSTKLTKSQSIGIKEETTKSHILLIIDGPNSLGKNYNDKLNIEKTVKYAQNLSKDADLYYFFKIGELSENFQKKLSRLGFKLFSHHKDIDHQIKDQITKELNSKYPPTTILFGSKDGDYTDFIKSIRKNYNTNFKLVISSKNGLSLALRTIFDPKDIKLYSCKGSKKSQKVKAKKIIKKRIQKLSREDYQKKYIEMCLFNDEINSFEDLEEKMKIKGLISTIKEFGVFIDIGISNDGFLPKRYISRSYVDKIEDFVKIGEFHDFRIIEVKESRRQFTLSLIDV